MFHKNRKIIPKSPSKIDLKKLSFSFAQVSFQF